MKLEDAVNELAKAEGYVPVEAIDWALDHWDEAGPRFVAMLAAYADGKPLTETERAALFLVVHILGEANEKKAFAPLLRLMKQPRLSDDLLGDAIGETVPSVLISLYDGGLDALKDLIEAEAADMFARAAAMDLLVHLARSGRLQEADARTYLRLLRARMRPRGESHVWAAWALAVAALGYEDMRPDVETLFEDEFIDPMFMRLDNFDRDLADAIAGRRVDTSGLCNKNEPFTDTIGTFARWHYFTPARLEEKARLAKRGEGEGGDAEPDYLAASGMPVVNPYRDIGRNDPCPCGSGKKFKKCCLPQMA